MRYMKVEEHCSHMKFFFFFFFKQKTAYEISACLVGSVAAWSSRGTEERGELFGTRYRIPRLKMSRAAKGRCHSTRKYKSK